MAQLSNPQNGLYNVFKMRFGQRATPTQRLRLLQLQGCVDGDIALKDVNQMMEWLEENRDMNAGNVEPLRYASELASGGVLLPIVLGYQSEYQEFQKNQKSAPPQAPTQAKTVSSSGINIEHPSMTPLSTLLNTVQSDRESFLDTTYYQACELLVQFWEKFHTGHLRSMFVKKIALLEYGNYAYTDLGKALTHLINTKPGPTGLQFYDKFANVPAQHILEAMEKCTPRLVGNLTVTLNIFLTSFATDFKNARHDRAAKTIDSDAMWSNLCESITELEIFGQNNISDALFQFLTQAGIETVVDLFSMLEDARENRTAIPDSPLLMWRVRKLLDHKEDILSTFESMN